MLLTSEKMMVVPAIPSARVEIAMKENERSCANAPSRFEVAEKVAHISQYGRLGAFGREILKR